MNVLDREGHRRESVRFRLFAESETAEEYDVRSVVEGVYSRFDRYRVFLNLAESRAWSGISAVAEHTVAYTVLTFCLDMAAALFVGFTVGIPELTFPAAAVFVLASSGFGLAVNRLDDLMDDAFFQREVFRKGLPPSAHV